MTRCEICDHFQTAGDTFQDIPICLMCWDDIHSDEELVDDLAREIYVKDYLIPEKRKR